MCTPLHLCCRRCPPPTQWRPGSQGMAVIVHNLFVVLRSTRPSSLSPSSARVTAAGCGCAEARRVVWRPLRARSALNPQPESLRRVPHPSPLPAVRQASPRHHRAGRGQRPKPAWDACIPCRRRISGDIRQDLCFDEAFFKDLNLVVQGEIVVIGDPVTAAPAPAQPPGGTRSPTSLRHRASPSPPPRIRVQPPTQAPGGALSSSSRAPVAVTPAPAAVLGGALLLSSSNDEHPRRRRRQFLFIDSES